MTVIANTFYLYQDYNHILSFFWRVGFSQEKRELWNTKMLLSFWKKICVFFFPLYFPKTYTYSHFPQKLGHVYLKDVGWSGQVPDTAIRGKRTSECSAKYSCLAQEAQPERLPSQNNMKCLSTCVQIVNDLPSVSKLNNDLKQNHMFYSLSRTVILFSQIISNFPFPENYSFFIHLFK